jgi:uncharacterized membrane protein
MDGLTMNFSDLVIITIRWLHVMATITWIGGNIIFYVVLKPSASEIKSNPNFKSFGQSFGEIVELSKWVLIITGALLTLDNLATRIEIPYFTILTLKVALSFLMFIMGYRSVKKSPIYNSNNSFRMLFSNRFNAYKLTQFSSQILGQVTTRNTIFVLGPIVVFLGIALRMI